MESGDGAGTDTVGGQCGGQWGDVVVACEECGTMVGAVVSCGVNVGAVEGPPVHDALCDGSLGDRSGCHQCSPHRSPWSQIPISQPPMRDHQATPTTLLVS